MRVFFKITANMNNKNAFSGTEYKTSGNSFRLLRLLFLKTLVLFSKFGVPSVTVEENLLF